MNNNNTTTISSIPNGKPGPATRAAKGKHPNGQQQALVDLQGTAPSPATTFFQLVCQEKPEPVVILREWPKKRFSQAYSTTMDPSQTKLTWDQFALGDLDDKIRYVFGEDGLNKVKNAIAAAKQ